MANPVKVPAIDKFVELKKSQPAVGIGELIVNALSCNPEDLYIVLLHMKDDVLVRRIEAFLQKT